MKVKKINIGISQKINLGNYETRDFSINLEIEDFENLDKAVDYGRDYCLEKTKEYYNQVKEALTNGLVKDKAEKESNKEVEKLILGAKTKEELKEMSNKVLDIKNEKVRKDLLKKFNIRLISFK